MIATRTIARKCKQLRRRGNMTRSQLAAKTGLSTRTINRIEGAEQSGYNPHLATLNELAKGFRIGLGEFLTAPARNR